MINRIVDSLKQVIWWYDKLPEQQKELLVSAYLTGRADRIREEIEGLSKEVNRAK